MKINYKNNNNLIKYEKAGWNESSEGPLEVVLRRTTNHDKFRDFLQHFWVWLEQVLSSTAPNEGSHSVLHIYHSTVTTQKLQEIAAELLHHKVLRTNAIVKCDSFQVCDTSFFLFFFFKFLYILGFGLGWHFSSDKLTGWMLVDLFLLSDLPN